MSKNETPEAWYVIKVLWILKITFLVPSTFEWSIQLGDLNQIIFTIQVCVLSLRPEPTVVCCNGVCNARILSIVSVPASQSAGADLPAAGDWPIRRTGHPTAPADWPPPALMMPAWGSAPATPAPLGGWATPPPPTAPTTSAHLLHSDWGGGNKSWIVNSDDGNVKTL